MQPQRISQKIERLEQNELKEDGLEKQPSSSKGSKRNSLLKPASKKIMKEPKGHKGKQSLNPNSKPKSAINLN